MINEILFQFRINLLNQLMIGVVVNPTFHCLTQFCKLHY